MVLADYADFIEDPPGPPTLPLIVIIEFYHAAHFSAPHGLGHSLHISCNVDSWWDVHPFCWASCCCFFLATICCGVLVGTDLVMLRACGYGAAAGAPSCPSCALMFGILSPLDSRCRLPPLRFLHRNRWMHHLMAVAGSIAATDLSS